MTKSQAQEVIRAVLARVDRIEVLRSSNEATRRQAEAFLNGHHLPAEFEAIDRLGVTELLMKMTADSNPAALQELVADQITLWALHALPEDLDRKGTTVAVRFKNDR